MCPKCIYSWGFISNPAGGAYNAPPDPLAGREALKNPSLVPHKCIPRQIPGYADKLSVLTMATLGRL